MAKVVERWQVNEVDYVLIKEKTGGREELVMLRDGRERILPLKGNVYLTGNLNVNDEKTAEQLVKEGKIVKINPKELYIKHLGLAAWYYKVYGTADENLGKRIDKIYDKLKEMGFIKREAGWNSLVPVAAEKIDEFELYFKEVEILEDSEFKYAEYGEGAGDDYVIVSYKFRKDTSTETIEKMVNIIEDLEDTIVTGILIGGDNSERLSEKVAEVEIMLDLDPEAPEVEEYLRKKARQKIHRKLLSLHLDFISTKKPNDMKEYISWANDEVIEITGLDRFLEIENQIHKELKGRWNKLSWKDYTPTGGRKGLSEKEYTEALEHNKRLYSTFAFRLSQRWAEGLPMKAVKYIIRKY